MQLLENLKKLTKGKEFQTKVKLMKLINLFQLLILCINYEFKFIKFILKTRWSCQLTIGGD